MRTMNFDGLELKIQQRLGTEHKARGGGPGGTVWPCGEAMARYMASQRAGSHEKVEPELSGVQPRSVLELGCGTGVLGITLALLGAPHVVATDGDAPSCKLAAVNAALSGANMQTAQLSWGEGQFGKSMPELERALSMLDGRCADWIVGADVVYEPQSTQELEVTLRELMSRGGCSLVAIGWCERGHHSEAFLQRLSDLGRVRTVAREFDRKFNYLTKMNGRFVTSEIEWGVTLLQVKSEVTAGWPYCGLRCWLGQMVRLWTARLAATCGSVRRGELVPV